jgi:diguanylate cyclase
MTDGASENAAESAAEILRLTVPLMSRHGVPATPQNYATWYSYVSGDNPELKAEVDRLISDETAFSPAVNAQLYRQFVAEHDLENIEKVRDGLQQMLVEVGASLGSAGDDAAAFSGKLGEAVQEAGSAAEPQSLRGLLETLLSETREMQATARSMQANFESKTHEIEELQEELRRERHRAITDPLTGLFNRQALVDRLNAVLGEFAESDTPPSLVMLDIDHFKQVNDSHGHLIGDRVIRFVAQTLQKNIKGKDCAARYGGEEFTLLLPETPPAGARAVAENILKAVSQAQLVRADNKQPLGKITVSAGVAGYVRGEDIMDFIERADRALYQSKNDGRDRVTVAE